MIAEWGRRVYRVAYTHAWDRHPSSGMPVSSVSEFATWYTVHCADLEEALEAGMIHAAYLRWRQRKLGELSEKDS